jgi:hypothetical protein
MTARLVFSLVLLSTLAACASVSDVRKKEPVFFGKTAKTPESYAACVSSAWRGQGRAVELLPISNGSDVVTSSGSNVEAVLRVQYYESVTHVTMSTRRPYNIQNMLEAANLCM